MTTRSSIKSGTSIRGSIPSQKSPRQMVTYQGLIKRAYIYLLEYDDSVQSYEREPFSLRYTAGTLHAIYTPDFRIQWTHQPSRPRLITCTTQEHGQTPFFLTQIEAAQQWCQMHQHDFALITNVTLEPHAILLANLQLLAVHAFAPIPPHIYDYLLTIIATIDGPFSPNDCVQYASQLHPHQTKSALWHLLYHGEILADLTEPLHFAKTALRWKHQYALSSSPPAPITICPFFAERANELRGT